MASSLLIKHCRILDRGKLKESHIFIRQGKIKSIGKAERAQKTIEAEGNIVIPGLIDCHVHFRQPGGEQKEDFYSGSRAAAKGGITSIFDMPNTNPATTTLAALKQKRELAKRHCIVNYGLHFGATPDNADMVRKADTKSVKIYMGSSTGNLLVNTPEALARIFMAAKQSGKVCMVHAEDEECLRNLKEMYKEQTANHAEAELHTKIRDSSCAAKAIKDALRLQAKIGNKLYFCHTSTKEEMALLRKAKQRSTKVFCEVTPHHLFLDVRAYRKYGNFVKVNPPLRHAEDREALWKGIADGTVDTISTDHAPHLPEEKGQGYWDAPSGMPGVETMLPLLLDAVNKGKLSLTKVVELTAWNPAKIFGIVNKGYIKVGYDADLVLADMNLSTRLESIESKSKWSPFQDMILQGWPVVTIINGDIAYYRGALYNTRGKPVAFA
ncbi:dihydroorotase [Candidatus Woesearchaeota archaeon]|nr:dihydroorotase [Candidatus Woesearchaeota archaeon]